MVINRIINALQRWSEWEDRTYHEANSRHDKWREQMEAREREERRRRKRRRESKQHVQEMIAKRKEEWNRYRESLNKR